MDARGGGMKAHGIPLRALRRIAELVNPKSVPTGGQPRDFARHDSACSQGKSMEEAASQPLAGIH